MAASLPSFKMYIAEADPWLLVEMDFSQLEVCGLAEITEDPVLIQELNSGVDIHTENAKKWLGKTTVTPEERKKAKMLTFQLQYGAGVQKMSESTGMPAKEVQDFVKNFYEKYKKINKYHADLVGMKVKNPNGCLLMDIAGRTYQFDPRVSKTNPDEKYISLPEMKNYPIQGFSTGTIVPVVTNMISKLIGNSESIKIINTVHDSLLFKCHNEGVESLFFWIEKAFVDFPERFEKLFDDKLKVIYNYDIKIGSNWSDMDKYTRADVQNYLKSKGTDYADN